MVGGNCRWLHNRAYLPFQPPRLLPRSGWQREFAGPARHLIAVQRDDNIHRSSSSRSFDWMGVGCLPSLPVWRVVVAIRLLISEHRGNSHLYALYPLSSVLLSALLLGPAMHLNVTQIFAHARHRLVRAAEATRPPSVAPHFTEQRVHAPQLYLCLLIRY